MDVTLILVTLLSLALAAVMTVLAWRLAREQRRRSDARVAELAAEIHGGRDRDLPLHHAAPVVTSGRATIDSLAPGTESPFAVTIPHASDVGRYRVSFRTDDRIVPHIDRRDRPMAHAK